MLTINANDYDSYNNDVLVDFSSDEQTDNPMYMPTDKLVYIVDNESGDTIAVKKFYSTDDFTMNLSPVVKSLYAPDVMDGGVGFMSRLHLKSGHVSIGVSCGEGEDDSASVVLVYDKSWNDEPRLISNVSGAEERQISYGERDVLRFHVLPNTMITLKVRQYMRGYEAAVAEKVYTTQSDSTGCVVFSFVVSLLAGSTYPSSDRDLLERMEVVVTGTIWGDIDTVNYKIVPMAMNVERLAWVSSSGAVEHYTFENVVKSGYAKDGSLRKTIRSAPVSSAMREFFAEIAHTPRLWVVEGQYYHKATLLSSVIEIAREGELAPVEFEIEYRDEH